MNKQRLLRGIVAGQLLVVPTVGFSAPGTLADKPLFLTNSVKHNVILAIDDSGSMDFETLFDNADGALYLDKTSGSFFDSSGNFSNISNSPLYAYLFPNGYNTTSYDASIRSGGSFRRIPPIKAYAFARSFAYNKSYYDPAQTYTPWPSYGGFTFGQIDETQAPFDPVTATSTKTLDLTKNFDTSTKGTGWGFDIQSTNMPCEDDGSICSSTGEKHYTYYPATYYVVDKTSTYQFSPTNTSGYIHAGNSILLESESATLTGLMKSNSALTQTPTVASAANTASNNEFIGTDDATTNNANSPPLSDQASLSFSLSAAKTMVVWLRVYAPSGDSDSFWLNFNNIPSTSITVADTGNTWVNVSGQSWNKFWSNIPTGSWTWIKWATLTVPAGSNTLNIRMREDGTLLDQILLTEISSYTPSGPQVLGPTPTIQTRSCATDIQPIYYEAFRRSPNDFIGVDAIGPDGACLKKYEIKPATAAYPSGRTYAQEIDNFANWFTYYRRRHQAMRGGLASAFQGISGIRTGLFWINNQSDVTMWDMDNSTDVTSFLTSHLNHVSAGGTPLRSSLNYAGDQYMRTDTGAPITEACQKNFTLLFTDGFDNGKEITDISPNDDAASAPYGDATPGTLADVAYKFYETKLRSDKTAGKVSTPSACSSTPHAASLDCKKDLHMNTYTVGLGAKGTIYGVTHNSVEDAYTTTPAWPDVNSVRNNNQIDDLYHAAINGRGDIFSARTPSALKETLSDALRDIISKIGAASSVTFNTATLNTESLIYSASFNSSAWNGLFKAQRLNATTGAVEAQVWEASALLDSRNLSSDPRVILTHNGTDGVAFQWANLIASQQADLNTSPSGTDALGSDRLSYLRGNRALEGSTFRTRSSRLGDFVNSSPVYVGRPAVSWPDADPFGAATERYSSYRNGTAKDRKPIVYVGSNDGMLHGFDATADTTSGGGKEVIAYIPRAAYSSSSNSGLHYLTDPAYAHKFYADLTPEVSDVYISRVLPSGPKAWRTVLVGGMRGGGRGLFALDVSDPTEFTESNAANLVLWDFTSANDSDLGYLTSPPVITMMNNNKWAVVFGNGYNADSSTTNSYLFVLFLEEGVDGWAASDYVKIPTGAASGLSPVSVADLNGDGKADRIYSGDLNGNMWVFDVSSSNTSSWGSAYKQGSTPKPLFTAKNSSGVAQPITSAPVLTRNTFSTGGNTDGSDVLVYFGTGQYLANGDVTTSAVQSFYAVWDRGDKELTRSNLVARTYTQTATNRITSGGAIDWNTNSTRKHGWYMDFVTDSGERVVYSPRVRGQTLFFNTIIPESSPCSYGGSGWIMATTLEGLTPTKPVIDGDRSGSIEANEASVAGVKQTDSLLNEGNFLGDNLYVNKGEELDRLQVEDLGDDERLGRLGWMELVQ